MNGNKYSPGSAQNGSEGFQNSGYSEGLLGYN